jgi:hypothetical protein
MRIAFAGALGRLPAAESGEPGGPGFEPRLTESESAVLPLNYPPTGSSKKALRRTFVAQATLNMAPGVDAVKRPRSRPGIGLFLVGELPRPGTDGANQPPKP